MKKPYLSIIIPVYNVPEKLLKNCLESVFNQSYYGCEYEVIIVNDGSTDNSLNICQEYIKNHSNSILINQKNKGLCGARNSGFMIAKGKYITFLDGDDRIDLKTIERLYKIINTYKNYDIYLFGTVKEFPNYKEKYNYNNFFKNKNSFKNKDCSEVTKSILIFERQLGDSTAKLYNRNFLLKNNLLHDEVIKQGVEAMDFNLRVFDKCNSIYFINEYFYYYTFNDASITNRFNEKKAINHLIGYKKILSYILKNKNYEFEQLLYLRLMHNIISISISGYFNPTVKMKYRMRKKKLKDYLNIDIINNSLKKVDKNKLSKKYRIIINLITHNCYFIIFILGYIRYKQKNK